MLRRVPWAALVAATVVSAACGGGAGTDGRATATQPAAEPQPPAPLDPSVTVKVADIQASSQAGLYLAIDRGYFADEGLEVQLEPVTSTAAQIALFATGDLDLGTGPPTPGLFNAVEQGVDLRVVASWVTQEEGDATLALVVRKDLVDSGQVADVADLDGRRVAIASLEEPFLLERFLEAGDLTMDDVEVEALTYVDMVPALANGAVDAALMLEPFTSLAEQQGFGQAIVPSGDVYEGPVTFVYAGRLVDERPEVVERFLTALLRGQADLQEAFFGEGSERDAVIEVLTRFTRLTDPQDWADLAAKRGVPRVSTDGAIERGVMDTFQDSFVSLGVQGAVVAEDDVVDGSFLSRAVRRLDR